MAVFTSTGTDEFVDAPGFFTSEHLIAAYQLFHAFNRYVYKSGLTMMPVAATTPVASLPATSSRVVQLHQPSGFRIYTWAVEREGKKPLLPHPVPQSATNEVLLGAQVCPHAPELDASGAVHTYFVEGVYVYGLLVPVLNGSRYVAGVGILQDLLRMGSTLYDSTLGDDNVYSPSDFTATQ